MHKCIDFKPGTRPKCRDLTEISAPNAEISPRSLHLGRFLGLQPNIINIININININNIINIRLK